MAAPVRSRRKRFRPTDAFVDESIRGRRYLIGCVLIEARDLPATRAAVGALPTRGRRLHFNNEDDPQKRLLLGAMSELPVRALVVVCHRRHGISEFVAREACLSALVREVQALKVERLVIESRQDDREDARIIRRVRHAEPTLVFEHRTPQREPMLGLADGLSWAAGAGSAWQTLVAPLVDRVIELRPYSAEPGSPTYGWATGSASRSACDGHRSVCERESPIASEL